MAKAKIESKQTLSREEVGAFLTELGGQLAKGDVDMDRHDVTFKLDVPDEVKLEVELEFDDGGTELEIELHW